MVVTVVQAHCNRVYSFLNLLFLMSEYIMTQSFMISGITREYKDILCEIPFSSAWSAPLKSNGIFIVENVYSCLFNG